MQVKFTASIKQVVSKQLVSGDKGARIIIEIDNPTQSVIEGINQVWGSPGNASGEIQVILEA